MKKGRFLSAFFVVFGGALTIFVINRIEPVKKELSELTDSAEIKTYLEEKLCELPAESEEAREMAGLYERVYLKSKGKTGRTETPGYFMEALKEIKIAFDGTSYKSNYRTEALTKADIRKRLFKTAGVEELPWIERRIANCSGRTQQLVIDPSDPDGSTWFAATIGGGVWKTTNFGRTWSNKTPQLTSLSTSTIDICRSNPNIMYVGTGMGFGRVVDLAGSGVWKSIDHGDSWFQLESTANNELLAAVNRLVVSPDDPNLVVVCSNDDYTSYGPNGGERKSGIFRTTDGGVTWSQVFDPDVTLGTATDNRVQHIVANPNNFNILYAAVNEVGVIKSTDAGATWFVSADNFADPRYIGSFNGSYQGISTRVELAVAPSNPNRVYAAVERTLGVAQLYMTKDGGNTWINVPDTGTNPNWFNQTATSGVAGAYTAGWFDNTIVVSPWDENVVYVGGVELYRIDVDDINNTRRAVEIAGTGVVHADHHDIDIIPVNKSTDSYIIVNSNDGGVAVSYDKGNTWEEIFGLGSNQFYGADKAPGLNAYIGGLQDNGTWVSSADAGTNSNWFHVLGGDGFEAVWHYYDVNKLIGGAQNSTLRKSTNGGVSWQTSFPGAEDEGAPFITKIASSNQDPELVFTIIGGGIKRSEDFGITWTDSQINGNWLGFRAFDNVEISIADPQIVWATSPLVAYPWLGRRGGIHVSSDGGLTFNEISQNFPYTVTESSGVGTHPYDPNTAFMLFSAAGTPKILKTTDLGNNWTDISGFTGESGVLNKINTSENESSNGFPDVATYCLLVMPYDTDILWAGTEIGLFISTDGGASWNIDDSGIPHVGIFSMFYQDGQVVVSTYGRGIWTVDLPELSDYEIPTITLAPRITSLYQQPTGEVLAKYEMRSPYDSTKLIVNGIMEKAFSANTDPISDEISFMVFKKDIYEVFIKSFKDRREYRSATRIVEATNQVAQNSYVNDFNSSLAAQDFEGERFSIRLVDGFSSRAIHSEHLYQASGEFTYRLKTPIVVASSEATIKYDDVALIEIGTSSDYTNPYFFDYVIVEGSKDGTIWVPLIDGYDSSFDPVWKSAYNTSIVNNNSLTAGNESMFRSHTIDLLNTYNPGDVIYIRFRLSSDPAAVAWGWVIDNLEIQGKINNAENEDTEIPRSYSLSQNYPNPFNPSTTIRYNLPISGNVKFTIYNSNGESVMTLVNKYQQAGNHSVRWNGKNQWGNLAVSGVYFYTLESGDFVQTKKMILVK